MYSDEAYNCPYCGKDASQCTVAEEWGFYGSHCPDCDRDFETPDT